MVLHSPLSRARALALVGVVLLLCVPAFPVVSAAAPDDLLFARPFRLNRIQDDPWAGGVWLGTEAGLFLHSYEGGLRHFAYAEGLPGTMVIDVVPTPGQVWIGTATGLAVLDKGTQAVRIATLGGNVWQAAVRTVFPEGPTIWVGTDNAGLFKVDASTLEATPVMNPVNGSTFTHPIYGVGSSGSVLYISAPGYGLVQWDRATGQAKRFSFTYTQSKPYYGHILVEQDAVWIGTDGDGAMRFDRKAEGMHEFSSPNDVNALTVYQPLRVGRAVFFPTSVGVAMLNEADGSWQDWGDVPSGRLNDNANDLALVQGQVYAATGQGRIARYDVQAQAWVEETWWDPTQTLGHNVVVTCSEDGPRLVFGTGGGGALFLDPTTGKWARAGKEPDDQGAPRGIDIEAFAQNADSRFFGHGNGVSERVRATGEYRHYLITNQTTYSGQNPVKDLVLDGSDLWVATHASLQQRHYKTDPYVWNPGLLARLDLAQHTRTFYGEREGLASANVTAIALDGPRVWVGQMDGGLDVLDRTTNHITHVWPTTSRPASVSALAVADGALWVAAAGDGLVRIDPTTLEATQTDAMRAMVPDALLVDGDTLWVGTLFNGLHALDLPTQQVQSYHASGPVDHTAFCLVLRDGILYQGTGWGIERFATASRTFLPQLDHMTRGSDPTPEPQGKIAILSPDAGTSPTGRITVHGSADAPADARVIARAGEDAWAPATGVSDWSISLDVGDGSQSQTITARLVDAAGAVLAQSAVVLSAVDAPDTPGGQWVAATSETPVHVEHTPLTSVDVGQPLRFQVDAAGATNLTGRLELRRPGQDAYESIPLEARAGAWVATPPPFEQAGEASYRLVVQWVGGSARLPAPFDGHGGTYTLVVRDPGARANALLQGATSFALHPGPNLVQVTVQNSGDRLALFVVSLGGLAANWTDAPAGIEVPPGESRQLNLTVRVPVGAAAGSYGLSVQLSQAGIQAEPYVGQVELLVGGATSTRLAPHHGAPTPIGVPLLGLLAALLVLQWGRRGKAAPRP